MDRYSQSLDLQIDLARRLKRDRWVRNYTDYVAKDVAIGPVSDRLAHGLEEGHTYFITDEMIDLIQWAATSMPSHGLEAEHLPTPYGWAWLERPVVQNDGRGEPLTVRALSWQQVADQHGRQGILFAQWADHEEVSDREKELLGAALGEVRPKIGRIHLVHLATWRYGHDWLSDERLKELKEHVDERSEGTDGDESDASGMGPLTYDATLEAHTHSLGFATAMWAIMGQDLGRPEPVMPPKPARKRATRAGRKETNINIVHMRRNMGGDAEEGEGKRADGTRRVKVRYWVKPFWRRQWYPKQQVHRLILIPPHERGPADAPLKTKPTIRVVDR